MAGGFAEPGEAAAAAAAGAAAGAKAPPPPVSSSKPLLLLSLLFFFFFLLLEAQPLEAAETAARLKSDLVAKAHDDAAALQTRAAADIENQKRQALADIREEVARLTRGATEEVVTSSLDDATHADLIEKYIAQVGQLR